MRIFSLLFGNIHRRSSDKETKGFTEAFTDELTRPSFVNLTTLLNTIIIAFGCICATDTIVLFEKLRTRNIVNLGYSLIA